uniref:Peptidase metallopeptidase domain-containing protein n=1 Tax=Candidatus Kentrum sp. FW TaxID=2126338 RepID=A0A450T9D2_9GAMM|nr:MAG: hypothetical protein BECKFW1821B_GA0114236_10819 [Candidatus Kentron sp. FW]
MTKIIKVCIDRRLPEDLMEKAYHKAIMENPDNKPKGAEAKGLGDKELAMLSGKKWANGKTLKVSFMDGAPEVQAKVEKIPHIWSGFANIRFDFGNHHDAQIRISFAQEGSWSYLGTDALSIPTDEPTMNYGWFDEETDDEEYSRVVLHEFGHALGCVHEQASPNADIPWDEDRVYEYYGGPPNNWTKQEIYHNVLIKYGKTDGVEVSEFDPESIMIYAIPNEFTIGDFEIGWSRELSEKDKLMIREMYPPSTD